jgi:CheY-like chemotaxis protein
MNMSLNILLVEDNPLNQKIVVFHLKKHNFLVHVSSTGEEALAAFYKGDFDVVLMDLMLPGIDGFETTRSIREYEKSNPEKKECLIIALTANTLDNDREKCLQQGMNEFISKPFDMIKLNHILYKWK